MMSPLKSMRSSSKRKTVEHNNDIVKNAIEIALEQEENLLEKDEIIFLLKKMNKELTSKNEENVAVIAYYEKLVKKQDYVINRQKPLLDEAYESMLKYQQKDANQMKVVDDLNTKIKELESVIEKLENIIKKLVKTTDE